MLPQNRRDLGDEGRRACGAGAHRGSFSGAQRGVMGIMPGSEEEEFGLHHLPFHCGHLKFSEVLVGVGGAELVCPRAHLRCSSSSALGSTFPEPLPATKHPPLIAPRLSA